MPGEITRWLTTSAVERQHSRELDVVTRRTSLAEEQVAGIGQVTKRATFEAMQVNLLRGKAEQIAPDGAELYAMIAVAGAVEMTQVIAHMSRPGRC